MNIITSHSSEPTRNPSGSRRLPRWASNAIIGGAVTGGLVLLSSGVVQDALSRAGDYLRAKAVALHDSYEQVQSATTQGQ